MKRITKIVSTGITIIIIVFITFAVYEILQLKY